MLLDLPKDIIQFEILYFLPLRDVLHLQYAVPRTKIMSEWKQLYLKVKNASKREVNAFYFGEPFDHSRFQNAEQFELEFSNKTDLERHELKMQNPSIITSVNVLCPQNTYYNIGLIESYSFSNKYNEQQENIILPLNPSSRYDMYISTDDPDNCKVKLKGYYVEPDQLHMKATVSSHKKSPVIKFIHICTADTNENLDNIQLYDTEFNKNEIQLMWNMCKTYPRRSHEITIPCNLNSNDDYIYTFNGKFFEYKNKYYCKNTYFNALISTKKFMDITHYILW